eukprot:PhM_4_TR13717/c1_g1_i1/m.29260
MPPKRSRSAPKEPNLSAPSSSSSSKDQAAVAATVVAAVTDFSSSELAAYSPEDRALLDFLYSKKVMEFESHVMRKERFMMLLEGKPLPPGSMTGVAGARTMMKRDYSLAKERLRRIVSNNTDKHWDVTSVSSLDVQRFVNFVDVAPVWGDEEKSFVFFRDHPQLKGKPQSCAQRHQLSGLCYIHGPDVVQHYNVAMNTNERAPMLDMTAFIKNHFSPTDLEYHIFDDKGGNSRAMLKSILQPGSVVFASRSNFYAEHLKHYGPGLVSTFMVHEEFLPSHGSFSHRGKPTTTPVGLHAMVLVGARTEGGQDYFLLQNWWNEKQFVEVDADYLENCDATVSFVKTPQTSIPDEFPNYIADIAEAELLDKPETYALEM